MLKNNQLLQKMIYHAYETVPFYQRLIDDSIDIELTEVDKVPVVDKEFIVKSGKDSWCYQRNKLTCQWAITGFGVGNDWFPGG